MKTKRPIQILTVLFALGMLGAYVVYSQTRQTNRTVMPGSKSKQIDWTNQAPPPQATTSSNNMTNTLIPVAPRDMTVMSSSKVIVPVMSNPPATTTPGVSGDQSRAVIGGSKSSAVYTPAPATPANPSKAVIYGSKSAPAFVPASKPTAATGAPAKTNTATANAPQQ